MADLIHISLETDGDGNELEDKYVVELDGEPADLYSLSHDYFDSAVDAHAFAEQVSEETGVAITWGCSKPAWA